MLEMWSKEWGVFDVRFDRYVQFASELLKIRNISLYSEICNDMKLQIEVSTKKRMGVVIKIGINLGLFVMQCLMGRRHCAVTQECMILANLLLTVNILQTTKFPPIGMLSSNLH